MRLIHSGGTKCLIFMIADLLVLLYFTIMEKYLSNQTDYLDLCKQCQSTLNLLVPSKYNRYYRHFNRKYKIESKYPLHGLSHLYVR